MVTGKGNIILGVCLHVTRIFVLLKILTQGELTEFWAGFLVLLSWGVTEVARYPTYILKSSKACEIMRCTVPVLTFPLGAGAEAWAAWSVAKNEGCFGQTPTFQCVILFGILFQNVVLGVVLAYPAILHKARKSLKGPKEGKKANKKDT